MGHNYVVIKNKWRLPHILSYTSTKILLLQGVEGRVNHVHAQTTLYSWQNQGVKTYANKKRHAVLLPFLEQAFTKDKISQYTWTKCRSANIFWCVERKLMLPRECWGWSHRTGGAPDVIFPKCKTKRHFWPEPDYNTSSDDQKVRWCSCKIQLSGPGEECPYSHTSIRNIISPNRPWKIKPQLF